MRPFISNINCISWREQKYNCFRIHQWYKWHKKISDQWGAFCVWYKIKTWDWKWSRRQNSKVRLHEHDILLLLLQEAFVQDPRSLDRNRAPVVAVFAGDSRVWADCARATLARNRSTSASKVRVFKSENVDARVSWGWCYQILTSHFWASIARAETGVPAKMNAPFQHGLRIVRLDIFTVLTMFAQDQKISWIRCVAWTAALVHLLQHSVDVVDVFTTNALPSFLAEGERRSSLA